MGKGNVTYTFQFDGVDELEAKLQALGAEVNGEALLSDALNEGGEIVKSQIESTAPVWTGVLAGDIHISPAGKHVSINIGPGNRGFYGRFLEHGTSKMSARPFMRPALDGVRVQAEAAIAAALWEAIEASV